MILFDFIETVFNFIDTFKVTWYEINKDKNVLKTNYKKLNH